MKRNGKPYWKETLECYLVIFIIMFVFFGTFIVSGQLTGTDWAAYFWELSQGLNINIFK